MEKEFNQSEAWEIFEFYADGDFNEVADYEYGSAQSFFRSSSDFVPDRKLDKYKKELQEKFGVW